MCIVDEVEVEKKRRRLAPRVAGAAGSRGEKRSAGPEQ